MGLVLAAGLVAYNTLLDHIVDVGSWRYVALNSAAAVVLLWFGRVVGLSRNDMGLGRNRPEVVLWAAVAAVAIVAPLLAAALVERTAALVADERAAGVATPELLFVTLVRIPIGTALFEEVAFRGVLLGSLLHKGTRTAVVLSSAAFGLWHVDPALEALRLNAPNASWLVAAGYVTVSVVATAVGGAFFCWLRSKGNGILAPAAFHAAVNSGAFVAAVVAHARA